MPTSFNSLTVFLQDSTLITSASGRRFGLGAQDWKWWHGSVPGVLKSLHDEGCVLVLFYIQALSPPVR
jgi:bifunctional polynucleotide phosphatase/kinase